MSEVQGNSPIILDQHNEAHDNDILTYKGNRVKVSIRNSSHMKRTSVSRSSDFYGKFKC
jgi:hypothetical protein